MRLSKKEKRFILAAEKFQKKNVFWGTVCFSGFIVFEIGICIFTAFTEVKFFDLKYYAVGQAILWATLLLLLIIAKKRESVFLSIIRKSSKRS